MTKPRVWWSGEEGGWIIDTEIALTNAEVLRCAVYTRNVQVDRLKALRPGALRDECKRTIKALDTFKITQNIIGTGDKVLFDAYKSEGKKVFA